MTMAREETWLSNFYQKIHCSPFHHELIHYFARCSFTFKSGMLNFEVIARLLFFVVAACNFSHVCWHVFSPGADISQNSVMSVTRYFFQNQQRLWNIKQANQKLISFVSKVFQSHRISDNYNLLQNQSNIEYDLRQNQIYLPGSKFI